MQFSSQQLSANNKNFANQKFPFRELVSEIFWRPSQEKNWKNSVWKIQLKIWTCFGMHSTRVDVEVVLYKETSWEKGGMNQSGRRKAQKNHSAKILLRSIFNVLSRKSGTAKKCIAVKLSFMFCVKFTALDAVRY